MPTIKNWGWDAASVIGKVYGNPKFEDGHQIHTSAVKNIYRDDDGVLMADTQNTTYILDGVDPEYEKMFPDATERLLTIFRNVKDLEEKLDPHG